MNEIARIKNEIKLAEWTEIVKSRNESGLTVSEWGKQNGINLKTYYYRLKRIRQAVCNELEKHDIVPVEPMHFNNCNKKSPINHNLIYRRFFYTIKLHLL